MAQGLVVRKPIKSLRRFSSRLLKMFLKANFKLMIKEIISYPSLIVFSFAHTEGVITGLKRLETPGPV